MATLLITGTNRGIGLEFVTHYLQRGDTVIATCRNPDKAEALQKLGEHYSALQILPLDVTSDSSMASLASTLGDTPIDVFINNAGVYGPKNSSFGGLKSAEWSEVMLVNAIAPVVLTQYLLNNLRSGEQKKLIYITSKMGSVADNQGGGSHIYRSSKAALNAAVKSVAIDLMDEGFRVALLHPGWVLTDMGGPNALIDTKTSVSGMIDVIDELEMEQSGGFFSYDGATIPW